MANRSLCIAALLGCGLSLVTLPGRAAAQCQLCAPSQSAVVTKPVQPITLSVEAAIDFSKIGLVRVNQGGTATIDAATGQRTLTGSLVSLAGVPFAGSVLIRGEPRANIMVTLPTSVQLLNSSGSSYPLSSLTTTLKNNAKLGDDGTLRFTFGGQLQISGAATGTFRGSIPITVDYK